MCQNQELGTNKTYDGNAAKSRGHGAENVSSFKCDKQVLAAIETVTNWQGETSREWREQEKNRVTHRNGSERNL